MDVILDANVYVSDFRMEGVLFQSLFDYLKKTDSSLVIPRIVFDEVTARYTEMLSQGIEKAKKHLSLLRRLLLAAEIPQIDHIDLTRELNALRQKLNPNKEMLTRFDPAKQVTLLDDYSGVTIQEVARRGFERMPPASRGGEQLRDVIVWLSSVSYCRSSQSSVAFISGDKTFTGTGATTLQPRLQEELVRENVSLHFYRGIDDFLKAESLKPIPVTESWVEQSLSSAEISRRFEEEGHNSVIIPWHGDRTGLVLGSKVHFQNGSVYEIGAESQYCELEYSGLVSVRVIDKPYPPPEEIMPPEEARLERMRNPGQVEEYDLPALMRLSIRLVEGKMKNIETESYQVPSWPKPKLSFRLSQ